MVSRRQPATGSVHCRRDETREGAYALGLGTDARPCTPLTLWREGVSYDRTPERRLRRREWRASGKMGFSP